MAELYEGAVILLSQPTIPGRTRLIAHAVRELSNNLPIVLSPSKHKRVDYVNSVEGFATDWSDAGLGGTSSVPAATVTSSGSMPPATVPVPAHIVEKINLLINEHQQATLRLRDRVQAMYESVQADDQKDAAALRPVVAKWMELAKWSVKYCHIREGTDADLLNDDFTSKFSRFEDLLYSLSATFYSGLEEIDGILEEANTRTS